MSNSPYFFVHNAGIVLLSPFLPQYFKMTGLVKDGLFIDATAANRAVFLVQYLVKGKKYAEDGSLHLNNLLCGLSPEHVSTVVQLTDEEMKEGDSLLEAVIHNWGNLKDTSIDGLREAFLQRDGELLVKDETCVSYVERRAFDVLLDSIPWAYSLIKHKWMPKPLFIDWR
jgi:hypothetical protein